MTDKPLDASALLGGATPGPWEAREGSGFGVWLVDAIGRRFVATMDGKPGVENEANARLIAAAPNLARKVIALEGEVARKDAAIADAARMFDAIVPMTLDGHCRHKQSGEVRPSLSVISEAVKLCADTMRGALSHQEQPALEAIIAKYASHDDDCDSALNAGACTCGFDAALKEKTDGR